MRFEKPKIELAEPIVRKSRVVGDERSFFCGTDIRTGLRLLASRNRWSERTTT
jgi:hypothetical protein